MQMTHDALFIGEATLSMVLTIKSILRGFELVSGLKMNFHQSFCGALGVDIDTLMNYASLLIYLRQTICTTDKIDFNSK